MAERQEAVNTASQVPVPQESAHATTLKTSGIDRRGKRYGRLVCIEPTSKRQGGSIVWRCKCDCGNETLVSAKILATGDVRSCGCLRRETQAAKATDHTGKRYGRLTALEPLEDRRFGGVVWRCRCDCGNEVNVRGNDLVNGNRRSCGKCLPQEKNRTMKVIDQMLCDGMDADTILAALSQITSAAG